MFEIVMYRKPNGEIPVQQHIDSLDMKMQVKVLINIELLKIKGNKLREPYTKSLDDGIFELRTRVGSDTERILFFFVKDEAIVLTHGFIKKTRKTPSIEIRKAKEYRADYFT